MPVDHATDRFNAARFAVRIAALTGLLVLFWILSELELHYHSLSRARGPVLPVVFGLVLACGLATALPLGPSRRWILLGLSLAAYPILLGWGALPVLGYILLVVLIARLPGRTRFRAALALTLWAALPILRMRIAAPEWASTLAFGIVWAGLAFAALYLLVERDRGSLRGLRLGDELFYLLAIPRVATPFFQPIPPSEMLAAERRELPVRRTLESLALGLFAAALGAGLAEWSEIRALAATPGLRAMALFARVYALTAAWLFAAIALFRLLGFDLGSGFRWPLLSVSFADWFRRWNYYLRTAVISLFFFPIVARLRLILPIPVATVVAAYAGIAAVSLGLSSITIPLATAPAQLAPSVLATMFTWERLLLSSLYWTAIIIPQVGLGRRLPRPRTLSGRIAQRGVFWLLMITMMITGAALGVQIL